MAAITDNCSVSRRQDLLISELSESELVMLDINQSLYFGMETVAKQIWEHLATPCTVAELCEDLQALFEVDRETLEREVLAFLTSLQKNNLIKVEEGR